MEEGKHVVDADATGDRPTPLERLIDGAINFCASAECMHVRNPAAKRPAKYGAGFRGVDFLVVRVAGRGGARACDELAGAAEVCAFDLNANVAIEVASDAGCGVEVVNLLVLKAIDAAVDGVKIAVAGVDVDARIGDLGCCGIGLRKASSAGCNEASGHQQRFRDKFRATQRQGPSSTAEVPLMHSGLPAVYCNCPSCIRAILRKGFAIQAVASQSTVQMDASLCTGVAVAVTAK